MPECRPMSAEQARHIGEVHELWSEQAKLLMEARSFLGGLQWKTIGGHEYLYRYQPDPITRKKRSTSIGRRSPKTERFYAEFMTRRARVNSLLADRGAMAETLARVSKALRLARLPEAAADVLTALWKDGLTDFFIVHSGHAAFAYETTFRSLLPVPDGGRIELLFSDDSLARELSRSLAQCLLKLDASYEFDASASVFHSERGPEISINMQSVLLDHEADGTDIDDRQRSLLTDLLELPAVSGMAISRSGRPVPMTAPDPRAFAFSRLLNESPEDALGLAVASATRDHPEFEFGERFLDALPGLADAVLGGAGGLGPRL